MDLRALMRATHLVPAASVTAIVGGLAVALGGTGWQVGWAVASTAAGQASVGWSNDYLDRHPDAAAGRLDKPVVAGRLDPGSLRRLALVAGVASPLLALPLGPVPAAVMGAAVASAWAYNLGIKATPVSWLPYAVSFGLLPVFVWLSARGVAPAGWVVTSAALLGVAGHLMNVIPDLPDEAQGGGLPHRLGTFGSLLGAAALLAGVLALALLSGGAREGSGLAAGGAAAVLILTTVWAVLRGRPRAGFHLTIASAVAIGAVIVAARP